MYIQAANDASAGTEESHARQQAKTAKSLAAGALVQAALNAMAVVSPGKEIPISSGFLAPASPLAAVIAVQVRPACRCRAGPVLQSYCIIVPAKPPENIAKKQGTAQALDNVQIYESTRFSRAYPFT